MRKSDRSHWLSVALLGALACGGGGDDPFGKLDSDPFPELASETDFGTEQSSAEELGAQATLSSALALDSVIDDPEEALGSLNAVYTGAAEMLGSALGTQGSFLVGQRQRLVRPLERAASRAILRAAAPFPDCVVIEETATSVVFTFDCEQTEEGVTGALTGTISLATDGSTNSFSVRIHATASATVEGIQLNLDTAFVGDLSVSPDAIDGELLFRADLEQSYQGQSGSASLLGKVAYDVALSGPGCAVDGDIKVAVDVDVHASGQSGSFSGVAQAVFGPACNEVTVYARATAM